MKENNKGYGLVISTNSNYKEYSPSKDIGVLYSDVIPGPFDAMMIVEFAIEEWDITFPIDQLWLHVFEATKKDNSLYVDGEKYHKTFGGFTHNF